MANHIIGSFTIKIGKHQEQYEIQAIGLNDVVEAEPHPFTWLPTEEQKNTLDILPKDKEDSRTKTSRISLVQLISLGQAIYKAVFTPSIAIAFGRVQSKLKGSNGIRIRLLIEPPELTHLPWELMHDSHDFIAVRSNYPLVRGTKDGVSVREIAIRGKLKILYAWAEPQDMPKLELEGPAAKIQTLLAENKKIQFDILSKTTLAKLRTELDKDYHILCFAGHGNSESIFLEKNNNDRRADEISNLTLARALEGKPTRLVFLAACKTAAFMPLEQMTFGESLIYEANKAKAKVSSVVAMQYDVKDYQTNPLTVRFFEAIASFKPVDAALSEARKSILDEERQSMRATRDVFAPVMYLQSESSNLFRKARNWPAIGFATIFIIAALLGLVALSQARKSSIGELEARATAVAEATQRAYAQAGETEARATAVAEATQRSYAQAEANVQRLQAEARTLAVESGRLLDSEQVRSLVLAVQSFQKTYYSQETCETYVKEAEIALIQSLFTKSVLHTVLEPNDSTVTAAVFSPDGRHVVTSSANGTAQVWDTNTWEVITSFEGHTGRINSAEFSPDGIWIVTASNDGTAKVWEVETGMLITSFEKHTSGVQSATFSPDGLSIATVNPEDGTKIWNIITSEIIASFDSGAGGGYWAVFSPDGERILIGGVIDGDERVRISNIMTRELIASSDQYGFSGSFSPDGDQIVISNGDVSILDAWSGELLTTIELPGYLKTHAEFSPDGSQIAVSSIDGSVYILDVETGIMIASFKEHLDFVNSVTYSPDGLFIITASDDGTARVYERLNVGVPVTFFKGHTGKVNSAAFSPDGMWVVTASEDGTAKVWEVETSMLITSFEGHTSGVNSAVFSPDGTRVVTASEDGTAKVWEAETGILITSFEGHSSGVNSASFSPNGAWVVTAGFKSVIVWETETGEIISSFSELDGIIQNATFNPDGEQIIATNNDTVVLLNAATGHLISPIYNSIVPVGYISSVTFAPSGNQIIIAGNDLVLIDDAMGTLIKLSQMQPSFNTVSSIIESATFSASGNWIVIAGGRDKTASILESTTLIPIATLANHTDSVNSATFSPNGQRVATASDDGTAIIWEVDISILSMIANAEAHLARLLSPEEFSAVFDDKASCTSN